MQEIERSSRRKRSRNQLRTKEKRRRMNVQEGDKAVIVFSINPKNVGRIVNVAEYIGKFKEGEQFEAF